MKSLTYTKRQLSQWDFAPDGAFKVFRNVDTGLSQATCQFIFYENGELVKDDCPESVKGFLTTMEQHL